MTQVAVTKVNETGSESLLSELKSLTDRIRERAYSRFEKRGSGPGSDLEDWLEAERELMVRTESALLENEDSYQLNIALDGIDGDALEVIAAPGAVTVQGATMNADGSGESIRRTFFNRFELPVAINVEQVTAHLESGILQIDAPKTVLNTTSANQTNTNRRGASRDKAEMAKPAAA